MWGKTAVVIAGKLPDGAHQHNQSKSLGPLGSPSTSHHPRGLGLPCLQGPPEPRKRQLSPFPGMLQTSPVICFFRTAKQLSGRHPGQPFPGMCNLPPPGAGMPEGQTQPNIWIPSPVKSTAGPLADVSSVPQDILAIRRRSLSNL